MVGVLLRWRDVCLRGVPALVVLSVVASTAWGQGACYEYAANFTLFAGRNGDWVASEQAACESVANKMVGLSGFTGGAARVITGVSGVSAVGEYPSASCSVTAHWSGGLNITYDGSAFFVGRRDAQDPGICAPEDCASYEGPATSPAGWYWMVGAREDMTDTKCHKPSGCKATRSTLSCSDGQCVASYTIGYPAEREQCDGAQGQGEDPDVSEGEGEACIQGSDGSEWCVTAGNGKNCGYLNDSYVCLDATDEDGCQALEDGGRVCNGNAPVPPKPDGGTPGVAAQPDMVIETSTATYNYYNSTTVNNSSRPPNASGDNPNDGKDDGDGAGSGSTGGSGVGEGLMCDPQNDENCSEEGKGEGHGDDITEGWQCWEKKQEGETQDSYMEKLQSCFNVAAQRLEEGLRENSGVVGLFVNTAEAWPSGGGACPSANFSMWGIEGDFFDVPCDLLSEYQGFFSVLFKLFWLFLGMRILLSIPGGGE